MPGFALGCSCEELSEFPFHGRTHRLIGTQTAIWKFKDLSLAEIIRSNQSARSSTGSDNPNVLNSFLPKINSKRVSTFPVALRSSTDVDNSQSATATVVAVGNVPSEHLVGAHEIAERLGLSHAQSVHTLRRRHADFPEPVATLKTALIWDWRDVKRWAKQTRRLKS